jgi:hypothetical protein
MDNVTLIGAITGLMVLVIGIPLYFLPMILAHKKRQFLPVFLINLLLGWTFLGWRRL